MNLGMPKEKGRKTHKKREQEKEKYPGVLLRPKKKKKKNNLNPEVGEAY